MFARRLFWAASTIAMLSAALPAAAADVEPERLSPFSGQIDAWIGYWFIDGEEENVVPDEDSALTFGADGKFRIDMFDGVSVQGDLSYDTVDAEDGDDFHQGSLLAGGHLSWSNPDSGLLGIFTAAGSGESDGDDEDTEFWLFGGEGQIYFDNLTLYGQAGYFDAKDKEEPEDAFHDAWFGRIVGRYFFSPESRLQGEFSYADGEQDDDDQNMDVLSWGARYDHQVVDTMAVFVAYNGGLFENHGDGDDNGSYYDHVIRGGVSITLGRPDLLSVDRTGPNLDMPWAGHWASSGNIVD